jgi:hypothetical protein
MKKTIRNIKIELFWDFLRIKFLHSFNENKKRNWKRFKKKHNLINTNTSVRRAVRVGILRSSLQDSDDFILMNNPLHLVKGESSNLKVPILVIDKFIKQKDVLLYTFEK